MKNVFDKVASSWDNNPIRRKLTEAALNEIKKNIVLTNNMKALDYGTGTGLILNGIQPFVAHITGMDNSQGMLDMLKNKVKDQEMQNVDISQHNISNNNLGVDKYDLIVTNMTLHHIEDTNDFIAKSYAAIRNKGYLCIIDLETEDGTFHSRANEEKIHYGFDKNEIKKLFQTNGFNVKTIHTFYSITKTKENSEKSYPLFIAIAEKNLN